MFSLKLHNRKMVVATKWTLGRSFNPLRVVVFTGILNWNFLFLVLFQFICCVTLACLKCMAYGSIELMIVFLLPSSKHWKCKCTPPHLARTLSYSKQQIWWCKVSQWPWIEIWAWPSSEGNLQLSWNELSNRYKIFKFKVSLNFINDCQK